MQINSVIYIHGKFVLEKSWNKNYFNLTESIVSDRNRKWVWQKKVRALVTDYFSWLKLEKSGKIFVFPDFILCPFVYYIWYKYLRKDFLFSF